jgi:hypothetical protein
MFYFDIQTHTLPGRIPHLVAMLAGPVNRIHVSIDPTDLCLNDPHFRALPPSVEVSHSPVLSWGGASLAQQMVEALHRAVADEAPWEWFVNLSETCMPLHHPLALANLVSAAAAEHDAQAFCALQRMNRPQDVFPPSDLPRDQTVPYARVEFECDAEVAEAIRSGSFDPARNVFQRRVLRFIETGKNRFLLKRFAADDPRAMPKPFYFGRQWAILHRRLVADLCESGALDQAMEALSETFIPDECLLQTALHLHLGDGLPGVFPRALRYKNGAPSQLTPDDLATARARNTLFARKVPRSGWEHFSPPPVSARPNLKALFSVNRPRWEYATWCDPKQGYLYIETPKAGCTTIKLLLQKISGFPRPPKHQGIHHRKAVPSVPNALDFIDEIDDLIDEGKLYTFAFVREPVSRLVSAYRDKVLNSPGPFWEAYRGQMRVFHGLGEGADISFPQFVDWVASLPDNRRDPHWRSQLLLLQPHAIPYNQIGRLESLETDLTRIFRGFGVGEDILADIPRENAARALLIDVPPALKAQIREIYAKDCAFFGY